MILVDTGPIVAIASKRDQNHARCLAMLPTLVGPLVTTWACVAESMHLVSVLDRMLADGDSWAFSGFPGFPARRIDWYARVAAATPVAEGVKR